MALYTLITQLALYKQAWKSQGKYPCKTILKLFTLITSTAQHENTNYWYWTTRKHSAICAGVVGLASPAAKTINYHLACFALGGNLTGTI